ncbi:MAG: protein BatD [Deltaproteobacteria bacterium]|nr:protein BatD [Deltaproteobacteria bacterium]
MVNLEVPAKFLRTVLLLVLVLCVAASQAIAQVSLEVSPRVGALGETFVLSVVIESAAEISQPHLSPSEDFGISFIGPQSSVTIINGNVRKRVAYNYRLIPRRAGTLTTPSADVEVGGQTLHADALEVKVTEEAPTPRPQKVSGVSLRQSVDLKSAYLGQQIDSTLELQTAVNLIDPQFVDLSFDGFWVETIVDNERSSRVMSGDQYEILRFRKALFPLNTGTLTIPARRLKAQVREMRHNRSFPFDSFNPFDADMLDNFFGGGSLKEINVDSNELKVEVKPLPPAPKGLDTWGALTPLVGETTVSVRIPPGSLKVGDTKTIEVTVTSTGNLNPLKKVDLKTPASVKTYEDAPTSKNFESGGALMSRKIFRISIVPLRSGEIRVPPIELGYFDTTQESYRSATSQEIVLSVEGSAEPSLSQPSSAVDATAKGPDRTAPNVTTPTVSATTPTYEEESAFEKISSRVSTSMALLGLAGLIAILAAIRMLIAMRSRSAPARKAISEIEGAQTLESLSIAFRRYAAMKLRLGDGDLRGEQFRVLAERAISDSNVRFALLTTLDALDTALYSRDAAMNIDEMRQKALTTARLL